MSDYSSELPVRSQLPGQVLPDDVIIKMGDATNPTTQIAVVDTHGSQQSTIADASGNIIASQSISASNWLQVVTPSNGSAAGGTAAAYSLLAGGIYNSAAPTLTSGQQASLQLDAAGRLLVDAAVVFPYDENWGVVGATTLRTAAEIGNTTGAADFNYGTVGAQTLRVASQIGNATGAADFGAGATDAQTLRVAANQGAPNTVANAWPILLTNGTNTATVSAGGELLVTVATALPAGANNIGSVNQGTSPWVVTSQNFPTTVDTNYGTVGASTIRTAAQIGNATGAADFNNGATGAQTLRVAANLAVAGANVSVSNPVPVTITSASAGTPIQNFTDLSSIVVAGNATATYTVPATHSFSLERVWVSSEVRIKIIVQNNGSTVFVGFNSSANPNIDFTVTAPPTIVAGNAVTVQVFNIDHGVSDAYVTIEGNQIS
jgi:hypothetical protein